MPSHRSPYATGLGQIYDGNAIRCVESGSDCPTGQGISIDANGNMLCYTLELDNNERDTTQNQGAQGCHRAGRAYTQVETGGQIVNNSCVALSACPNGQGVNTDNVIVMAMEVAGARCDTANVNTCHNAGLGFDGTMCAERALCTAEQMYNTDNNTCVDTPPTQASECSSQGKILNLGETNADDDNRCVQSVAECNIGDTTNAMGDTCVDATGICLAPQGYDATTRQCVAEPTRIIECTSIGRILGTMTSTTTSTEGCVANAAACATEYVALDGACVGKVECVRLGQGYDASTKTCVSTGLMADDCYAASTDAVLNLAGNTCLPSRFDCDANQVAIGDTSAGFACQDKSVCLTSNQGYDNAERQCANVAAATRTRCSDASPTALFDPGTIGGCVTNANACSSGRVQGMTTIDNRVCITAEECRTGNVAGVGDSSTPGAVVGSSKVCAMANASNCAGFDGRSFDATTGCSTSRETIAANCTAHEGFQLVIGVGCTSSCSLNTQGYNATTNMCVNPTQVSHCQAVSKVYKPTNLNSPSGGGTCVGNSTADSSACDDNTALITGQCQSRSQCATSANNRQGYNATTKLCDTPTAVSCHAADSSNVFNAMVGSGDPACFEMATGCDDDEAAIANTDSQIVCQPKAQCLTVTGMTGFAGNATNACTTASGTTCFNVSGTAFFNAGSTACVATATGCQQDFAAVRMGTTAMCTAKRTACTGGIGFIAAQRVCGIPTSQSDCSGLVNLYWDARSGDDVCVATPADCEMNEAGITIAGGSLCRDRDAACTGRLIGYDATNKVCRIPQASTDCTSRATLMIYNPTSGDDVCVAAATDCDDDEALVTSTSTCTAKATACTGGAGFDPGTHRCVPSGAVTSVAQCAGLTFDIYNEGSTANMGSCVDVATDCDSEELVQSNACMAADDVCAAGEGFNNTTRMCIATVTHVSQCFTQRPIYNGTDDTCVATADGCENNETAEASTNNVCTAASTVCTSGRGYNSSTKQCIAVGSVTNENQCIGTTTYFNSTTEGNVTRGNCVASATHCDTDEMVGTEANTMRTCQSDPFVDCMAQGFVWVKATDVCQPPVSAADCRVTVVNRLYRSTNVLFVPAAVSGESKHKCVATPADCPTGSAVGAVRSGRIESTQCSLASRVCSPRQAAIAGKCVLAQNHCLSGAGYDMATRMCVASSGFASASAAEKAQYCIDVGRHLNAAADGCIARTEFCGASNVLASDGVTCRTETNCRTKGAVRGDYCVTASRNTCLADNGRVYDGTGCAQGTSSNCANVGATFSTNKCVETARATRLTNLRGSGTSTDAAAQGTGQQLTALATLRTSVQANAGNANSIGGLNVMTGDTRYDNRMRIIYANQPSLDAVGAAFVYHATDDVVNFGKGSTISYITDRSFGTGVARSDQVYGFTSEGGETALRRIQTDDFFLVRGASFVFDGSGRMGTVRSTSEDGSMRLLFSETRRVPRARTAVSDQNNDVNRRAHVILENAAYQLIEDEAYVLDATTVGSTWAAVVRAVANYYGFVDTGAFTRYYVSDGVGDVSGFGVDASGADKGILTLIAGMLDVSDGAIGNTGILRHTTHGIAPSANLNVLTTHGLRRDSTTKWVGSRREGFVDNRDSGKRLPKLAGGINVFDAILQAGAAATQKRGNVILLDNRLAADNINAVLWLRNPAGTPSDGLLRFQQSDDSGFDGNLASYLRLLDDEAVLRDVLDADNGVKVYNQRDTVRGNEINDFEGSADNFTDNLARIVIEGLYGSRTELYAREHDGSSFVRNNQGGDVLSALTRLGWKRYGGTRNQKETYHYDALIFAAQKSTGDDIGLFAGLPIYMHQKAMAVRAEEMTNVITHALQGTRDYKNFPASSDRVFEYDGQEASVSTIDLVDAIPPAVRRAVDRPILELPTGYRIAAPSGDTTDGVLVLTHLGRTVAFYGVPKDLLSSHASRDITNIAWDSSSNTATVTVSVAYGGQTTFEVFTQHRPYRSMRTLLPYYLAVVAAESGETPCGVIARDYCITAPGRYAYRDGTDETLTDAAADPNAAAALVAGGVALLQDVFKDQMNTEEIIARLKATASQNFDLDGVAGNDYVGNEASPKTIDELKGQVRYGHGLLDLACASRPSTNRNRCREVTVTAEITDAVCGLQGRVLQGSACVAACTGSNVLGRGITNKNNTCVALSECLSNNLGAGDGACVVASVDACVAAGGVFNKLSSAGAVDTCIAASACTGASGDALLNRLCRATGTANNVTTCAAAGALLDAAATPQCIMVGTCTGRSGGVRQYVNTATNECVAACEATEGITSTKRCTQSPMAGDCGRFGRGLFLRGGSCRNGCNSSQGLRGIDECVSDPIAAECQANGGRLLDGFGGDAMGRLKCITTATCTRRSGGMENRYVHRGGKRCVALCNLGEGVNSDSECTVTPVVGDCNRLSQLLGAHGQCVSTCSRDNVLFNGVDGGTCMSHMACTEMMTGARYVNLAEDTCVATCGASQGVTDAGLCTATPDVAACVRLSKVRISTHTCGVPTHCPGGEGVVNNDCVGVSSLSSSDRLSACAAASREVQGTACVLGEARLIEIFRGAGNSAATSGLASTSSVTDASSTALKQQREYANQPSLDIVGAAFAYGKIGNDKAGIDAALASLGKGSHISVITNRRFDPTHPAFDSSAQDARFDTLTRFRLHAEDLNGDATQANVIATYFPSDNDGRVQVYNDGFDASIGAFITIRVPNRNGRAFETISRNDFDAMLTARTDLQTFIREIINGSPSITTNGQKIATGRRGANFIFDDTGNNDIELTSDSADRNNYHHVGRFYADGNVASYEIIINTNNNVRDDGDDGNCVGTDVREEDDGTSCYASGVPVQANAARMGVFALINGLMNPNADNVAVNTHGIAPGARLTVITDRANYEGSAGEDIVYRARGIDVARDRTDAGTLRADDTRNIVILHNHQDTLNRVNSLSVINNVARGIYRRVYSALQLGAADTKTQDAYVFPMFDVAATSFVQTPVAGAALALSDRGVSIKEYSVIVVPVESERTTCGGHNYAPVLDICIAAPGTYAYRTKGSNNAYGGGDDGIATAISANAAASLVAGGLALLESLFPDETTSRLIDRLLLTASKNFNLDGGATNQYIHNNHGHGLMDLACAVKPMTSTTLDSTIRTSAGCVDRHAPTGMNAPPQNPQPEEKPQGYAEGDPLPEKDFNVDYCNIEGLRIILSGDLCSDDYILLADEDGNMVPETVGNLRFGMGFGDSLLQGLGITFFDAFDTAWTVSNRYNPYAHILSLSNIVIAPAETRFDIEDRFYAMRYGTRPGTRKTWHSDTAAIVMDFATQGMATKPYNVTRGQIRNTLTHDNMGADPYADVRFMLSAEDNMGVGRLKVMTYSGMAMGYALGLHAQGDAMMPSYLLTNRDSFHAPYLSLASSGLGGGMTYRFRDGGHIGFVMGEGTSLNADGTLPYQQQTSRPRAFAGMMEYAPHRNLMFQMGALQEENTLLASQGSGLFDIEGGATAFVGVQAKQPISDNWQALFSGYGGRTQLAGSQGIVSGLDVVTTSFDVGLLGSHVLEQGDHLLFRAGQPMRVESGSLDLSYVSYRDGNRGVVSGTQSFDVAPSMRSVEFGVGYGVPVGERQGHIRFAIDYVLNPGHRRVQDEIFGIMSFRRQF